MTLQHEVEKKQLLSDSNDRRMKEMEEMIDALQKELNGSPEKSNEIVQDQKADKLVSSIDDLIA